MYLKPNTKLFIRGKRLEWAGHVWKSNSLKKKVMMGTTNGKIPRGRPRQRGIDIVKSELQKYALGLKLEESEDKERWREIVEMANTLNEL